MKRTGQWGERARRRRAERRERARFRRLAIDHVREFWRDPDCPARRRGRRRCVRRELERQAREFGIEPKPGEFTKALRYRLRLIVHGHTAPFMGSRAALAALTGGEVRSDNATGRVEVVLPADTTDACFAEVEEIVREHTPVYVLVTVRRAEVSS